MNKYKIYYKLILQIFSFIIIFVTHVEAKNLDKFYKSEDISNYFSGVISLYENEYGKSYKYLKQLNNLEDKHLNYSSIYQQTLINDEKFNEAFNYSKKLENKEIDNFESNLIIGVYYLKNEDYKNASKYFKKMQDLKQKGPFQDLLSNILLIWSDLENSNYIDSKKKMDDIPKNFDNIKKIQNIFLNCYYETANADKEFQDFLTNSKTDFSRYHFFYANFLNKVGERRKAIEIIESAINLHPQNLLLNQFKKDLVENKKTFTNSFNCKILPEVIAEIFYVTANALSAQGIYSVSNFYLNLSKYLNPDFISYKNLYAENFYNIKEYKKSKKIYLEIKKTGSVYNWYASKRISLILSKQNQKEKSISFLEKTFNNIDKPDLNIIFDFAEFLKNNERFDESITHYSEILKQVKTDHYLFSEASDGRGVAYERTGSWPEAEKDFINSLNASPNQAYVMNYLAYSWIEKGINIEKSLKMLKKANEIKKNDPYIIDSLGWALYKLSNYNEAKKYLQMAISLLPSDPVVSDHYGDALWMTGNKLQARYYWNYALNLKKAKPDLKKIIEEKLFNGINANL